MKILAAIAFAAFLKAAETGPFIQKPYLQLGEESKSQDSLMLMWHAPSADGTWLVEVGTWGQFRNMPAPSARTIKLVNIPLHTVFSCKLTGLPNGPFDYRVSFNGKVVFQAKAKGRPGNSKAPYSVVVFGDSGADTWEQKEVAALTHKLDPSMVFHTGDIVYSRGLVSEYRTKHFPIYNADTAGALIGAPLIRSTLMVAAAGNHDLATRDLGTYPDALPYFYYWQQPLNGPELPMFSRLTGDPARIADFKAAAGGNFSRMVNYSFDWGNSHWLALDSNNYVDWSDPAFQKWVDDDLANSKATWKFVGFHHPGFNSSKAHFEDQQARLMAPIFEKRGVDIVFSGHVHNYQRSFPLEYKPEKFDLSKSRVVTGKWELDRAFDGASNMKPKGVIYIVTGAGGNRLYNPEQEDDSRSWQEFTVRFVSKIHSLTELLIDGKRAIFLQRDRAGNVIDHFTISK